MKRIPAAGACRTWDPGADYFEPVFQQVIECSLNSTTT